jgi:hypothetical protein
MDFCRFSPRPRIWHECLLGALIAMAVPQHARAADPVQLILANHRFEPDNLTVPAGERFRIELTNQDDTTDEFESYDMKFEKIVVSGGISRFSPGRCTRAPTSSSTIITRTRRPEPSPRRPDNHARQPAHCVS